VICGLDEAFGGTYFSIAPLPAAPDFLEDYISFILSKSFFALIDLAICDAWLLVYDPLTLI